MIDLSEESLEENIEISAKYLERMAKMNMTLEIELGCTGGEETALTTLIWTRLSYTLLQKTLHMHTRN